MLFQSGIFMNYMDSYECLITIKYWQFSEWQLTGKFTRLLLYSSVVSDS